LALFEVCYKARVGRNWANSPIVIISAAGIPNPKRIGLTLGITALGRSITTTTPFGASGGLREGLKFNFIMIRSSVGEVVTVAASVGVLVSTRMM
jgi:hypothetical protein